jgi:formylglycine-generating enzyme required for sulfatase activity
MAFEDHAFSTAQLVDTPDLEPEAFSTARWHEVELVQVLFPSLRPADLAAFLRQVEKEGGAAARASLPTATAWAFFEPLQRDALPPGATAAAAAPLSLTLVEIPAGSFLMGSPPKKPERLDDEGPQHEVKLASFFISQTPITQAQWREVAAWQERPGEWWGRELDKDSSLFQSKGVGDENYTDLLEGECNTDNRPVEQVSWEDAIEFCNRLSQRTGRTYTLPSESQWEYACRAGRAKPFYFGDRISTKLANYDGKYAYAGGPQGVNREQTTPVGVFSANAWGLHDMHGNVWEWCLDVWHASYDLGQQKAPGDGSPWLNEDEWERGVKFLDNADVLYDGATYKNWRITVTPTSLGYMYETAAPGQEFTGLLPGLPHESIDECLRIAKRSIDAALEQSGGSLVEDERVLRGGSWGSNPGYCRSACRSHVRPDYASDGVGFRVVCLPQAPSLNP